MAKTIDTLVQDMYETILGNNGWDSLVGEMMGKNISEMAAKRFSAPQEPRGYLSLSSIGTPCDRKLWYKINRTDLSEKLPASALLKFFYGDMIEELALSIAASSGHTVTGTQDRLDCHGIKGHRDAVIDGMTIDVKSASPYAYKKFKEGNLREDDPFGYISQLSSYVYAAKDDPLVTDKKRGAFLAIDKVNGHICLDIYDFSDELDKKAEEIEKTKAMVQGDIPDRSYEDVPQSATSPNRKLPVSCSYCDFKKECWPNLRKFLYRSGPEFLTKVIKAPNVNEDTNF
jgi:hypothetical protein